jgi:hypothetical protein
MQRRTFLNLGLAGLGATIAVTKNLPAQYIPASSNPRWAILFGTWYGTARDAGIWISEGLGGIATVLDIRQILPNLSQNLEAVRTQYPNVFDSRPSSVDLTTYDHLIIGSSIHGGKGPQALQTYLANNADLIKSKIRGLFIVCGNNGNMPGQTQVTSYIDGWLAKDCKVSLGSAYKKAFGGRITKSLVTSASDYAVVKNYNDYDNLSRTACMDFGKTIYAANA